jgi:hypothetical protein
MKGAKSKAIFILQRTKTTMSATPSQCAYPSYTNIGSKKYMGCESVKYFSKACQKGNYWRQHKAIIL